jgi:hypothetical protein
MRKQDTRRVRKARKKPYLYGRSRLLDANLSLEAAHPSQYFLDPWTEVVGTVQNVEKDCIIMECRSILRVYCTDATLTKHRDLLKKGKLVGILMTDSGSRIRTAKMRLINS